MLGTIIATLVVGTIIGLLGKMVAPGNRDNIPLWLVIICGMVGAFVGSYLYYAVFGVAGNNPGGDMNDTSKGVDWWRHLWQIGAAAILVVGAATVTGRKKIAS